MKSHRLLVTVLEVQKPQSYSRASYKGGRNNALAEFVGGLLIRGVDPEITYHLAKMANSNTSEPLGDKEFERTFKSMLDKEIRRIGLDND